MEFLLAPSGGKNQSKLFLSRVLGEISNCARKTIPVQKMSELKPYEHCLTHVTLLIGVTLDVFRGRYEIISIYSLKLSVII